MKFCTMYLQFNLCFILYFVNDIKNITYQSLFIIFVFCHSVALAKYFSPITISIIHYMIGTIQCVTQLYYYYFLQYMYNNAIQ